MKIVIDYFVVFFDMCLIYVWCIRCVKNVLMKMRLISIVFVVFVNIKSEYLRVLIYVMNFVNGCF